MSEMIATGDMDSVERQLTVFARVALEPDPAAMARVRAAVLREAQLGWTLRSGAARGGLGDLGDRARPAARRRPFGGWTSRRLATVLAAAALSGLLLGGTAYASSRAGGPLYDTRLWLEGVTMPTDPEARLQAEIARAQTRLAEAAEAEAAGDADAVAAALGAYTRIVDQTLAEGGAGVDGAERATLAFQHHQSVLTDLQETLRESGSPAADAVANALVRSSQAIDRLGGRQADPATRVTPEPRSDGRPAATPDAPAATPSARPTHAGPPDDPGPASQGGGNGSGGSGAGGGRSDPGRPAGAPERGNGGG